jgi:hypothetical protein
MIAEVVFVPGNASDKSGLERQRICQRDDLTVCIDKATLDSVAIGRDGTVFISDEYGPYLFKFDRQGHLLARIPVPSKLLLASPPAGPHQHDRAAMRVD